MTKNTASDNINTLMVDLTKDNGPTGNKMVKESSSPLKELKEKAYGKVEKEPSGLMNQNKEKTDLNI